MIPMRMLGVETKHAFKVFIEKTCALFLFRKVYKIEIGLLVWYMTASHINETIFNEAGDENADISTSLPYFWRKN